MEDTPTLKVIYADMMEHGALIGFSDGTTAVFSAALLHSILSRAERVEEKDMEEKAKERSTRRGLS